MESLFQKVKFEVLFNRPLNSYRQMLCKRIFAYLKNLFSSICGFQIPDSGFRFLHFRVAQNVLRSLKSSRAGSRVDQTVKKLLFYQRNAEKRHYNVIQIQLFNV